MHARLPNGYYYILSYFDKLLKKYAYGYQVTWLPVTFVLNNVHVTIKV